MRTKIVLLAGFLAGCLGAHAQVAPAAKGSPVSLYAGGQFSLFKPDYGTNWLSGVGAYVDFNLTPRFAVEGEARFLRFNQKLEVHEDNYLIGPKITFPHRRWGPYAKVLLGAGEINFPYSYAHGGYFDLALGGGVDYRPNRKWKLRVVDVEYQTWPGFLNSKGLTPWGLSFGASYRIF